MFATLFAVVVALLLGHVAPMFAAAVRDYGWYRGWLGWLDGRFPDDGFWRGPWGIALALSPPLLGVAFLQVALHDAVYGFPALLFGVAVLFYAWGPRDLDQDVDAIVAAPDADARREAAARLRPAATGVDDDAAALAAGGLVGDVFQAALRRWFGVLFWFLLLGATGALLYRLAALAAEDEAAARLPEGTVAGARTLLAVLDWPVAQLMTLSMALVANFDVVAAAWKANGGASFRLDAGFLVAAGRASVRNELAEEAAEAAGDGVALVSDATPLPELRDAMSVVWRILLAWLALLALFVVAGWVG